MAFKPQKPSPDFSKIDGHIHHKHAPEPKPKKHEEISVPASGQLDSENLKAFSYDRATQTLIIKFHDHNRRYQYSPISPAQVRGLIDAESANTYFKANIEKLLDGELES